MGLPGKETGPLRQQGHILESNNLRTEEVLKSFLFLGVIMKVY